MEKKTVGVSGGDVQNKRFRQCLLSDYLLLKAYLPVTKMQTQTQTDAPNQHRKSGNDGQWASQIQRNNPHTIAYLCSVAWDGMS
jgi:hypothetical protein